MSNRITIDELKSYLWNSAVFLRTSIDAGAYKQYIFPLLFFKRICDYMMRKHRRPSRNTAKISTCTLRKNSIHSSFPRDTIGMMSAK